MTADAPARTRRGSLILVAWGWALILGGGALASWIQTSGGTVRVTDVRWEGADSTVMSGMLYVPQSATAASPAPGVVAIHGYINSRETQSGFAIELSRRGYVVLAADQTGHGFSDPPAFANGYGGPDALAYLRSLPFVDPENVGLEGHSMGGWASAIAAAINPGRYRALALVGSSTGTAGAPEGTPDAPDNVTVIFSRWDEFAPLMWGVPTGAAVVDSPKLQALFGTTGRVEVGRIYGNPAEGTARRLTIPRTTHPGDHLSREAIGDVVTWFDATLEGGRTLPVTDQRWPWKELGTTLGIVGMFLLVFGTGGWFLHAKPFAALAGGPAPSRAATGVGWWVAAAVFALLGPATLFPLTGLYGRMGWPASALFPQNITSQVVFFTTVVAFVSLALFGLWHVRSGRGGGAGGAGALDACGLTRGGRVPWPHLARAAVLALLVGGVAYLSLAVTDALFLTDFRFWVFGIKLMGAAHVRAFAGYLPFFLAFFLVTHVVLAGQLRRAVGPSAEVAMAALLLAGGWVLLLAAQYGALLSRGVMLVPSQPLWTIIAFQFVPLMGVAGAIMAYFFRRTGLVYLGSMLSALLVTWIVVASQATHFG